MASISNSSIQQWLDLDDFQDWTASTIIPPSCRGYNYATGATDDLINCTTICNDPREIMNAEAPDNLRICGLFSSLTMLHLYKAAGATLDFLPPNQLETVGNIFAHVGLDATNETYAYETKDAVSTCMATMQRVTRIQTYQGAASLQGACSQQYLFPIGINYNNENLTMPVQTCTDAICQPRSLNPDLGGIGVFTSLLLQILLPIICVLALTILSIWQSKKSKKHNDSHTLALSTTLLDLHKAQCYFVSAIQIAALVLDRQAYSDYKATHSPVVPPVLDVLLSIPLAMNGFLPTTFTLTYLPRYGRLTWHILLLTLVPFVLSSASLATAIKWLSAITDDYGPDGLSVGNTKVDLSGPLAMAKLVCGSSSSFLYQSIDRSNFRFALVWLVYANCVVWFVWCVAIHVLGRSSEGSLVHRIVRPCASLLRDSGSEKHPRTLLRRVGYGLFVLLWMLCFVYHIRLYSLFTWSSLVSTEWTFGQIIAVTAWIPSIVEYCYIEINGIEEASKYKYPPPLQVFKSMVQSSVGLANFEALPQSAEEEPRDA